MMRKTVKSRSTESSAAAERLADYKGDLGSAGGCSTGEDHGGGGCCSAGSGGANSDTLPAISPATTNSGGTGCARVQKESSQQSATVNQHTAPTSTSKDLSIKGMKEKKPSTSSLGSGDSTQVKVVRVMVDDSKPKHTSKKNRPIQADLDVSKEFNRSVEL
nr:leucine-rich repeat protein soc-2 homolog [Penaeus vannamei]